MGSWHLTEMSGSRTVHLLLTQLHNAFYSRSYAEDVTSVTSGASQGPHSFNLVFVCLCHAWRYPVSVPYSTVPSNTASWPHAAGRNIQIGLSNARS